MKKKYRPGKAAVTAVVLLTGMALAASCSQELVIGGDTLPAGDNLIPVRIAVGADKPSATRADADLRSQRFDIGEHFEAYFGTNIIFTPPQPQNSTVYDITSQGMADNDAEPRVQPYVKKGVTSANKVQAYFPSKAAGNVASFTVSRRQDQEANYNASDLMYAEGTVSGIDGLAETVTGSRTLTFQHRLGCIVVNATAYSDLRIKEVQVITGKCAINITDKETFKVGTSLSGDITTSNPLYLYKDDTGRSSVRCAAMIPPQTFPKNIEALCVVTDKGKVFFKITTADLPIQAGHRYTLNLYIAHVDIGTVCQLAIQTWTPDGNIELSRGQEGEFAVDGYLFSMLPVSTSFKLGMTEVTNLLYQKVMGSKPSGQSNNADEAPVSNITYAQAEAFITALNTKIAAQIPDGWKFALPTLAQWKEAAHASGYTHDYYYAGTTFNLGQYAWYNANSGSKTQNVGMKLPNELGFYDMTGNVSEWVTDKGANSQPLCVGGNYTTKPGTELEPDSELYIDYWTTSRNGASTADKVRGLRLALVPAP